MRFRIEPAARVAVAQPIARLMLGAVGLGLLAQPALAADGAAIFDQRCKACHQGQATAMGPSLRGVAGARIAGRPGYSYSTALKKRAGTWTDGQLDAWLAGSAKFAPGTKMMVAIRSPEDRAALVSHLKTLK